MIDLEKNRLVIFQLCQTTRRYQGMRFRPSQLVDVSVSREMDEIPEGGAPPVISWFMLVYNPHL